MRWQPFSIGLAAAMLLVGCDTANPVLAEGNAKQSSATAPLELTGRVVDQARVIPKTEEAGLAARLAEIESDTQAQVVVVTTSSLQGQPIEDYALALGNGWGVGDAQRNDGVILLIAPNDRQVRIEVGVGLEDHLTNLRSQEIINAMLASFRTGDFVAGIQTGVNGIDATIREKLETTS